MSRKDYTTSANHGKNKTRADEKKNIHGSVYKYRAPKRQYTKATQDAKAAFLMQSGYNSQRSNYDIVKPINQAKAEIQGNSSYGRGYGKGPAVDHVDAFDARKKKLGYQAVGDGSVNGTKNNTSVATPKGRMATSEKKGSSKKGYYPMDTSDSSATLWGKSDRYRDGSGSKHIKSSRKSAKQTFKQKKKPLVKGGSTGKRGLK